MIPKTVLKSFSYKQITELDKKSEKFKELALEVVAEFKNVGFLCLDQLPYFDDQEFLDSLKW